MTGFEKEMKESQIPKAKFRVGAIQVAIWENEGKDGLKYQSVSLDRSYKVGEEWKSTKSLKANDLPKAILALQKAYEYISLKGIDLPFVADEPSKAVSSGERLAKLIA